MDRWWKILLIIDFDWLECGGGGGGGVFLFFLICVFYYVLKGKIIYLVSMRYFCEFWYIYRLRFENCVLLKIYLVRKIWILIFWCKWLIDCIVFFFWLKFLFDFFNID